MSAVNATHLERIPPFVKDGEKYLIHAIIETPRDIRHKYVFDPAFGAFRLHQTIAEGLEWPYDYGFVPQTLGDDGDPLDVLFLCDEPTFPGCLVEARLLGLIRLDKNGIRNDRLLAGARRMKGITQSTDGYDTIKDIPPESVDSICRFLVEYSVEQGNKITFKGIQSRKKALRAIEDGLRAFRKKHDRAKR
jgi:inorganic pyrophosphatase